jgi:hypothetical protein
MKTQKKNIMSKKNKNQNAELIEKLKEIQSQINDIQSEAGIVVEEADIVFTREQLEDFLISYTNKVNSFIFDEMINSLEANDVVTIEVEGRVIVPSIDEDSLRDEFINTTDEIDSSIIMEFADEAMVEVGII